MEITEITAEERIKKAARTIFTRKGFHATTVRDIAKLSEINVSMVNYYFRSKEKLFELIMAETMQKLFSKIEPVLMDESTSLFEKFEGITSYYIDQVLEDPDLPFFIVNEIMAGSNKLPAITNLPSLMGSRFAVQLEEISGSGTIKFHPFHIILNMLSMMIFPFLSLRQSVNSGLFSQEELTGMMLERKKLIPVWLEQMLHTSRKT